MWPGSAMTRTCQLIWVPTGAGDRHWFLARSATICGPKGSIARMRSTSLRDDKWKGRRLFFVSLCMAIAVALFSALAPLGLPSSRLTGSAFNPATTSVVLKARSPLVGAGPALHEPEGNGSKLRFFPIIPSWNLPVTIIFPGTRAIIAARWTSYYYGQPRPLTIVSKKQARAPPPRF